MKFLNLCGFEVKGAGSLTLAGDIHAKIDAINGVDVDGARLHEHGCVSFCALATSRVRCLVFPAQVGLRLHHPASQLRAVRMPAHQHLTNTLDLMKTLG